MSRVSRKPIGYSSVDAWLYEGLGLRVDPMPSSKAIRKADHAMALSARGLCGFCAGTLNEDERCLTCFGVEAE